MTEKGTDGEISQMRSIIGSLGWIARQCRPDLSYEVSHGQSRVSKALLQDLKRNVWRKAMKELFISLSKLEAR